MEEIWKDVPNYKGYYKVSNIGNILSLERKVKSSRSKNGYRTVRRRLLKTRIDKYGYNTIILRKFNVDQHFTIHRLVCLVFILNPNNLPSINHKDENKLNNDVNNLHWCTVKYNNLYNDRQLKINEKLKLTVKGKIVNQYDLDGNFIKQYRSLREMYRCTNYSRQLVKNVCLGLKSDYKNYLWKFN